MPADDSLDVCPHSADKRRRSALYELASGQEWAVGIEQLRDLGYTRHEIYGMCRRGELTRVGRGVFLVSREQPTPRGQLFIAQLALGPHAFLSHAGAPMAYGLRPIVKSLIEVTVPGRPRRRRDIKVHGTTNLHLRDVCTYQGLRVSTIPRMLIELAPREPRAELEKLVTSSIHNGLFDYDATTGALERYRRWPGMTAAAAALEEYVWVPRDKSTFERDFAAFLAPHADIPPPARNVRIGPYELDVYWPWPINHAIELDGRRYHEAVRDRTRDNAKDIWLQKRGITFMRISDYAFTQRRPQILADVRDFLALKRRAA